MANANEIAAAIDARVRDTKQPNYGAWTVGVTEDPARRKTEHGNPPYWMQWRADSEDHGRAVERHFLDKGMKGGAGGPGAATYVYIF
ncbi:MAG: hypothetical protein SF051_10950 [Elusimicrobiota bacterium]|nr:hypothetical protein [Elusimicrobiota bacterium]